MAIALTASSQAAVDVGIRILGHGGNAVDAAVAAALASCVADPCNTGIGGYGGYMVVAPFGRPAVCIRFGFWAPTCYSVDRLRRTPFPETGPAASAVPNVVAGLARALEAFGRLDWATVLAPAVELATHGAQANRTTRTAFDECRGLDFVDDCFAFAGVDTGEDLVFRQPKLAATLERLAEHGPKWFYEGPLGELACETWQRAGIDVPLSDWRGAPDAVEIVPAAQFEFDGHVVISAPLGFTGSACVFAFLEAARRLAADRQVDDPEAIADLASTMASVWHYRMAAPGGNQFEGVALQDWIERALSHRSTGDALRPAPGHTAHLNVLDGEDTLVALTFTQGPVWFGGRWCPGDSGVIMNAGMKNFAAAAPIPRGGRLFGVSNMSPTIMEMASGGRVAVGSPGARRIPGSIALMLSRLLWSGLDPAAAVTAGRFHAETTDWVSYEKGRLPAATGDVLSRRFAEVRDEGWQHHFGPLTAICVDINGGACIGLDDRAPGFGAVA